MSKNDHFFCCNEMTRIMDGGKSSFPHKQLMSAANMGRNKLNDALKALESGEQKFYLKVSEHSCADFPSSISHCLLNTCNNKIPVFVLASCHACKFILAKDFIYFVMHRTGVTIVKTPHLIHPPSKDIPNNFVPFDIVMILSEQCGELMGQGTICLHCKAPVTSPASDEGKQTAFVLLVSYIYSYMVF